MKHIAEGVVINKGELVRVKSHGIIEMPRTSLNFLGNFERRVNGAIDAEPIEVKVKGLPREFEGYTIAAVSDIHLPKAFYLACDIIRAVEAAKPDMICVLGDVIDASSKDVGRLSPFFEGLLRVAPIAAILGNNDYASTEFGILRDIYEKTGVTLLEDESITVRRGGGALRFIGVQDPFAYVAHMEKKRAATDERAEPVSGTPGDINILLMHRPQRAARYAKRGFHLCLAGHAHGGQWRLPWGQGLFAPGQGLFPRLTSGLYKYGASSLVVSRGLGNHEFPLRLNNRPHLPVVRLGVAAQELGR